MSNSASNITKWHNLIESMYNNQLVVFAGAGCSAIEDIPTGSILGEKLCKKVIRRYGKAPNTICNGSGTTKLEDIAEYINDISGKKETIFQLYDFESWNRKSIDKDGFHARIANLVLEKCLENVITVNYDCLFEKAFQKRDILYKSVVIKEDFENIPQNRKQVLKIYGCIGRNKNEWKKIIIITKTDLKNWGKSPEDEWIIEAIKTNLRAKKFLVLGFREFQEELRRNVIEVVNDLAHQEEQFYWIGRNRIAKPYVQEFFKEFNHVSVANNYYYFESLPQFAKEAQEEILRYCTEDCQDEIISKIEELGSGILEGRTIIEDRWEEIKKRIFEIGNDSFNLHFQLFIGDHSTYYPLRDHEQQFIEFLVTLTFIYTLLVEIFQINIRMFNGFNHLEFSRELNSHSQPQIRNLFLYNAQQQRKLKIPLSFNDILNRSTKKAEERIKFIPQKYEDQNISLVIVLTAFTKIESGFPIKTYYSDETLDFNFLSFSTIIESLESDISKEDYLEGCFQDKLKKNG